MREPGREFSEVAIEFVRFTFSDEIYAAIGEVLNEASHGKPRRRVPRAVAKADALHAPGEKNFAPFLGHIN